MFEVVSLDMNPKCNPDILANILAWDYTTFAPNRFDIIWASPPCTHFSILRTTGSPRDIDFANKLVARTLEIIKYFNPQVWFLENPGSGYLKQQPHMQGIPYVDVHYCKYGYSYRKWTRIWTNIPEQLQPRICKMDCDALIRDALTGVYRHKGTFGGIFSGTPLHQRYSIPPLLVHDLMTAACNYLLKKSIKIYITNRITSDMVGGKRLPIRVRSVHVDDPTDICEYASISEAAKSLEGQTTLNNIRAALTRCAAKGEPFCGRLWSSVEPLSDESVTHKGNVKPKAVAHEPNPVNDVATSSIRIAELDVQKHHVMLKTKQVELLLKYMESMPTAASDASIHTLVKQYLV
jgi:hypothetical protein